MLNEVIMAHMLLFPEMAKPYWEWLNDHEQTRVWIHIETRGNPALVFGNCSLRRQGFTFVCVGGGRRNGCSSLSPPPVKTEKNALDQPPFHSHGSYYGGLQLQDICSAINNGARTRVCCDWSRRTPSSCSSSTSSCPLPQSSALSVVCV